MRIRLENRFFPTGNIKNLIFFLEKITFFSNKFLIGKTFHGTEKGALSSPNAFCWLITFKQWKGNSLINLKFLSKKTQCQKKPKVTLYTRKALSKKILKSEKKQTGPLRSPLYFCKHKNFWFTARIERTYPCFSDLVSPSGNSKLTSRLSGS